MILKMSSFSSSTSSADTASTSKVSSLVLASSMSLHISSLLRSSTVVPATLDDYESAVNAFLQFCSNHLLTGTTSQEVDFYLSQYMESLYQNSIPNGKQYAANALHGIIRRCPQYKLSFPNSRQALKGFQRLVTSVSYLPITYYTCVAMAAVMTKSGLLHHAIALLLMFHCYLRIGEMEALLISDVALPEQGKFGSSNILSALRIAKAKTGKNQTVSITDSHVHILLQSIMNNRATTEKLFYFSASAFTRKFRKSLDTLGLSNMFVPHSCRHGGATHDHIHGMSIEQIMLRGRWKSNASARTYIQSLPAVMLTSHIPVHIHTMGKSCAKDLSNNLFNLALSQL
jgi:integrase